MSVLLLSIFFRRSGFKADRVGQLVMPAWQLCHGARNRVNSKRNESPWQLEFVLNVNTVTRKKLVTPDSMLAHNESFILGCTMLSLKVITNV